MFHGTRSVWVRRTCPGCGHNGLHYIGFPRCSFIVITSCSLFKDSNFFKEGGVTDLRSSIFYQSSNTLPHQRTEVCIPYQSGLKGMALSPMSCYCHFSWEIIPWEVFLGLVFPSLVGFFHGLNFSVHFLVSSTIVWLPVLVLTFTTRKMTSSGRLQVKNPFSKLHLEFRDLAMVSKIYRTYYWILFTSGFGFSCCH